MKRYSEQNTCPKCGTIGARTEYYYGTGQFDDEGNKLPDVSPFLARTCVRCGFGWKEAPLDATEAEAKEEKAY